MKWSALLLSLCAVMASAEVSIRAKALLKGSALLEINGTERFLKQGQESPEGVTLLSADSKSARVRVNGIEKTLTLSRHIGAAFEQPALAEVRLPRGDGGHYWAQGQINGRPARMMIDTGATSLAMSEVHARSLGLRYQEGQAGVVSTAGGRARSWMILLDNVAVGGVVVRQVPAVVIEGNFPEMILLGNSFLDKTDLDREQGVLVIRSRF